MRKLLFFIPRFITLFRILEPVDDSPNCFVAVRVRKEHFDMPKLTVAHLKVFTFLGFTKVLSSSISEVDIDEFKKEALNA